MRSRWGVCGSFLRPHPPPLPRPEAAHTAAISSPGTDDCITKMSLREGEEGGKSHVAILRGSKSSLVLLRSSGSL